MSEVKVNKISPRSGTTVTLGDSGDTITLASGVSLTGVNATFSGDLTVDTDTLYVDSANNSVGIGTTSPSEKLEVNGNIRVGVGSETAPSLQIGDNDTGLFDAGANAIGFTTNGSEKVRIVQGGSVGIGTTNPGQKLHVEGSIYTSGSLYVGGTTSANALDDYEEGTFTPSWGGGTTDPSGVYSTLTSGSYTKVGRLVTVLILIRGGATTSAGSGSLLIRGLPFASATTTGAERGSFNINYSNDFLADNSPAGGFGTSGESYINLVKYSSDPRDGLFSTCTTTGSLNTGSSNFNYIIIGGHYYTD